jgi:hypothetical protein
MHAAKGVLAFSALIVPILGAAWLGAGFLTFRHKPPMQSKFYVTSLSELPDDGTPVLKAVYQKQYDAWTRLPDQRIGNVFVRKDPMTARVSIFRSSHHAEFRIPLRYEAEAKQYVSCWWNVAFDLRGKEIRKLCAQASGFDMTSLPLQIRDEGVWVCVPATSL